MAETTSNVEIAHHTHESGEKGAGTCVGTEIAPKPLRRAPDGQRRCKVVTSLVGRTPSLRKDHQSLAFRGTAVSGASGFGCALFARATHLKLVGVSEIEDRLRTSAGLATASASSLSDCRSAQRCYPRNASRRDRDGRTHSGLDRRSQRRISCARCLRLRPRAAPRRCLHRSESSSSPR
jgi:hypothetical protein